MTPVEFITSKTFFTEEQLRSPMRGRKPLAEARQLLMWLWVRVEGPRSAAQVGRLLGRDETTVRHAVKKVENLPELKTKGVQLLREYRKGRRAAAL